MSSESKILSVILLHQSWTDKDSFESDLSIPKTATNSFVPSIILSCFSDDIEIVGVDPELFDFISTLN